MSSTITLHFLTPLSFKPASFLPTHKNPTITDSNPTPNPKEMWRTFARRASNSSQNLSFSGTPSPSSLTPISGFLGFSQDFVSSEKNRILGLRTPLIHRFSEMCFGQNGELSPSIGYSQYPIAKISGYSSNSKSFASVAEAVSLTDADEEASVVEEIQGMLEEISRAETRGGNKETGKFEEVRLRPQPEQQRALPAMGSGKYFILRRRQIEIETEAWEQAAKEYKELLMDMCEQKLAPNLPYVKSLFLGWFEPLKDRIAEEQEQCRGVRNKTPHGPYFNLLPADMMAVITMHKLMSLLMTGIGDGTVRVVQAACQIGEAIEQEVGKIWSGDCF